MTDQLIARVDRIARHLGPVTGLLERVAARVLPTRTVAAEGCTWSPCGNYCNSWYHVRVYNFLNYVWEPNGKGWYYCDCPQVSGSC